ncbi:MAG: glycine cleavage system protein H [Deltaproteobacteria bacterium]|nr:glycine cleavage system protein H [Deltaproteobacteria bacterium]
MILAFTLAAAFLLVLGMSALLVVCEKGHERAWHWLRGLHKVRGFLLHPAFFYHPGHTWIMPQANGTVRIGIDDFGQRLLDGIRKVSLPPTGCRVIEGIAAIELDCGKRKARLLSPVNGVVTGVNERLTQESSPLARDPYGKGWLFTAKVSDQSYVRLPTGATAAEWLKRETDQLSLLLHKGLGLTAADGGELISKPPTMLSEDHWKALVTTFFHTTESEGEMRKE